MNTGFSHESTFLILHSDWMGSWFIGRLRWGAWIWELCNLPKSDGKSAPGPQLQAASAPAQQTWRTCLVGAQLDNLTLILGSSKATKFQSQTSLRWRQYTDELQWWRPQLTRDTKYKPEMKCSNMRLKNNSLRKKKKNYWGFLFGNDGAH